MSCVFLIQEKFDKAQNDVLKSVHLFNKKEERAARRAEVVRRLEEVREQRCARREAVFLNQRKVNMEGREKMLKERARRRKHREMLRSELLRRLAEREHRDLEVKKMSVMEWQCRDAYSESMREVIKQQRKQALCAEVRDSIKVIAVIFILL